MAEMEGQELQQGQARMQEALAIQQAPLPALLLQAGVVELVLS